MIRRIFRWFLVPFLLVVLTALTAWYYPEKFLCVDSGKVSGDVIVLLGGGVGRPARAAELFRQHAATHIIVTGEGDDELNRQLLLRAGVPASAIEVENKSKTTRENAEFTIKRLRAEKYQHVILVTSWYHARRAERTFEHYAPELKFYSRPSYFGFAREDWSKNNVGKRMRLEFLKLPAYWIWHGVYPF
jgi:uncharacterized SAM-binding protein YcdF (DUF218 family)